MTHILAKQLDELMGVNRNGDRSNLIVKEFSDSRVCKFDLCGLCPYKLFPNTKQDLGKCPYEICPAPDDFKTKYNVERRRTDFGYERELEQILDRLQRECDDRISRHQRRLEIQQKNSVTNEPEELKTVRERVEAMSREIEELTNAQEFEKANDLMEQLQMLTKEKESLESKLPTAKEQQLVVCEICAALLSANESDQRLADHFAGKMHLGFQKIRDKLKELRENRSFEDRRQRDTNRARGSTHGREGDEDYYEKDFEYRRKRYADERSHGYGRSHYHHNPTSSPPATTTSNTSNTNMTNGDTLDQNNGDHYHPSSNTGYGGRRDTGDGPRDHYDSRGGESGGYRGHHRGGRDRYNRDQSHPYHSNNRSGGGRDYDRDREGGYHGGRQPYGGNRSSHGDRGQDYHGGGRSGGGNRY